MAKTFTYYYGPFENPLKATVTVGTGKGQCAAGEGVCKEHPTKNQWDSMVRNFKTAELHKELVEKAESNAVTLEEYNDPEFNKFFHGWTLDITVVDARTGKNLYRKKFEKIRTRKEAEGILITFPVGDNEVPTGWLTNSAGNHFISDPFYYKKRFTEEQYFKENFNKKEQQ